MSISQNFPEEGPTLNLNFAGSKTLDPRITFSRTTTGTYMDANGLIVTAPADSPRFDHRYVNGEIESLGLLVEEQRSNLITYSDTLVTGWSHIGFTSNAVDSTYPNPTGNLGTKKLVEETGNTSNQKVLYEDVTVGINTNSNDQVFSHSIFVKPIGDRNAQINIHNVAPSNAKGFTVNFNLSDLTTFATSASASSSLDDYGVVPYPNGWYKIYVVGNTGSLNSDGTTLRFHLRILNSSGNQIYDGDGSSGLYAYGAQMELGAFPTSYIPTQSSTATREPDNAYIASDNFDWYNENEGTLVTQYKIKYNIESNYVRVSEIKDIYSDMYYSHQLVLDNSVTKCRSFYRNSSDTTNINTGLIGVDLDSPMICVDSTNGESTRTQRNYSGGFPYGTYNGSLRKPLISNNIRLSIGCHTGNDISSFASHLNGHIYRLSFYPTKLSNDQMLTLVK